MPENSQNHSSSCSQCGKPKRESRSGTLTGWIFDAVNCRCDFTIPEANSQATTAPLVCLTCKQPIRTAKKASITQWIFGPGRCACTKTDVKVFDKPPVLDIIETRIPELNDGSLLVPERYKLKRLLGRGGAAIVCEAEDIFLKRTVAVKILNRVALESEQLIRFQTEAKVTSQLVHPNIVQVFDFGVNQNGQPFMVLEYIIGNTLRELINTNGALGSDEARRIFTGVASALAFAQKNGINHRDLKPDNLIIQTNLKTGTVAKIIDFGLAGYVQSLDSFTTESGITLIGTPAYMSPDQARGLTFDVSSEIYTFGCVLFESLVGHPPFTASTPLELLAKHCNTDPPRISTLSPSVDSELGLVVEKCLQKLPEDRFQSFDQILTILEGLAVEDMDTASPLRDELSKTGKRPYSYVAIALTAIATLVLFLAYSFGQEVRPDADLPKLRTKKTADLDADMLHDVAEQPRINVAAGGKRIRLRGNFTRKDFSQVLDYPNIESLDAFDGQHLDPEGFNSLSQLPLRSVNLSESDADDRILHILAGMPSIERLMLKGTNLTDKGLAEIALLPVLKELVIDRCKVSDAGIASLSKSSALVRLSISSVEHLTKEGLKELRGLPLQYFLYSNNQLEDDDIRAICRLKANDLYLSNCGIDDRKTKLFNSTTVKMLIVTNNKIGLDGLGALLKLPNIEKITLSSGPGLTQAKITALKRALNSRCQVTVV